MGRKHGNLDRCTLNLSRGGNIIQSSLHRKGKKIRSGGDRGDLVSSLHSLLEASGILGGVLSSGRKERRGDEKGRELYFGPWCVKRRTEIPRTENH